MHSQFQAHALGHGLTAAVLRGSGVGAAFAGLYLAVGLAQGAAPQPVVEAAATTHDHQRLLVAYSTGPASPQPAAVIRQNVEAPADGFKSVSFKRSTDLKRGGDLDCLTKAVYFEARGETLTGQAAVAQVVLNRVRHPAFPKSVCAVVFQGCQFSFACDGSLRRAHEPGAWRRAHTIAARALAGAVVAEVGGATHFHAAAVRPNWGPGLQRVSQVGLHVFYRLNRGAVRRAPVEQATLVRLDQAQEAAPQAYRIASVMPAEVTTEAAPQPAPATEPDAAVTQPAV